MVTEKMYKELDKENSLARAKKKWLQKRQEEAVEHYRKMIGRKTEHKWVRNEDGTIMFSGHRSCDVGVDEMRFLRKE